MPADAPRSCPHCAHDRCHIQEVDDQPGEAFAVWCDECGARGPMDVTEDEAVRKWNVRYGHESPTHVLDQRKQ